MGVFVWFDCYKEPYTEHLINVFLCIELMDQIMFDPLNQTLNALDEICHIAIRYCTDIVGL